MINDYFNGVRRNNGFWFFRKLEREKQINTSIGMLRDDPPEFSMPNRTIAFQGQAATSPTFPG
jgi:hypothetical protein